MKHNHANHTCHDVYKKNGNISIIKESSRIGKLFHTGTLRFAGWWSIFAGLLAVNSVCPICGSSACPIGIGTTGIVAGLFAAIKQWGGKFIEIIRHKTSHFIHFFRKTDTTSTL